MRFLSLVLTIALAFSFGCQESPRGEEASDPVSEDKIWQGLVSIGAEAQMYRSCESGELMWIVDESSRLYQRYDSLVEAEKYYPVFAELRGTVRLADEQETAGGSDKEIFMVEEIVNVQQNIPENCRQWFDPVYTATGSDPSWELTINPYAKRAALIMNEANDTTFFNYRPPVEEEGETVFRFSAADTAMTAAFKMEPCQTGSQTFSHTVEVKKGESTYRGCAYTFMGVPPNDQPEL